MIVSWWSFTYLTTQPRNWKVHTRIGTWVWSANHFRSHVDRKFRLRSLLTRLSSTCSDSTFIFVSRQIIRFSGSVQRSVECQGSRDLFLFVYNAVRCGFGPLCHLPLAKQHTSTLSTLSTIRTGSDRVDLRLRTFVPGSRQLACLKFDFLYRMFSHAWPRSCQLRGRGPLEKPKARSFSRSLVA